jgi:hypothetical protein
MKVKSHATINQKLTLKIPPVAHFADCPAAAASNSRRKDAAAKRIGRTKPLMTEEITPDD